MRLNKYCNYRVGRPYKKEGSLLTWLNIRCEKTGDTCDSYYFNRKVKKIKEVKNELVR